MVLGQGRIVEMHMVRYRSRTRRAEGFLVKVKLLGQLHVDATPTKAGRVDYILCARTSTGFGYVCTKIPRNTGTAVTCTSMKVRVLLWYVYGMSESFGKRY